MPYNNTAHYKEKRKKKYQNQITRNWSRHERTEIEEQYLMTLW